MDLSAAQIHADVYSTQQTSLVAFNQGNVEPENTKWRNLL